MSSTLGTSGTFLIVNVFWHFELISKYVVAQRIDIFVG